jgi:hypothetical protein
MLSEHFCRVFERLDVAAAPVVGLRQARAALSSYDPDLVLCDYDLLTPTHLELWRGDSASAAVPIVAVSLTKRPDEIDARLEARGVAAFLHLPTLNPTAARALFSTLRRTRDGVASPNRLSWPGTTPVARYR